MVCLAKCKDRICPLKEISKKEGISFDYLEKIAARLEKAGLVGAKKGAQGGYFLNKKPSKIKIGEIIRALEGEKSLVKCMAGNYHCPMEGKCLSKKFWEKIQSSINSVLNSLTLADLVSR